jgi:hypothetical protein
MCADVYATIEELVNDPDRDADLGVAYITHATEGFYTYGFLDPSLGAGRLAGYICGIAIGVAVVYLVTAQLLPRLVMRLRHDKGDKIDAHSPVQEDDEASLGMKEVETR